MIKKLLYGLVCLVGMASCTEDYTDWAQPQQNEQPEIVSFGNGSISAVSLIDFTDIAEDQALVKVCEITAPSASDEKYNSTYYKLHLNNGEVSDVTDNGEVAVSFLKDVLERTYGKAPVERELKGVVEQWISNGETAVKTATSGEFVIKAKLNAPHLPSKVYLIGAPNNWGKAGDNLDRTVATSLEFEHSSASVYDDPVFTLTIDAPEGDCWMSILYDDDLNAFLNGDWNVLVGNTLSNGCEDLTGKLQKRSAFGGENNFKMPSSLGATGYTIKVNVLDETYEIIPITPGFVYDTNPVLYMTGSNYGWGSEWLPLVPVNGHETLSWKIIYLHEGEEFKFAPQAGWGGDFGMSATIVDNAGMTPTGTDNIVVGKAGWYLIIVDNADTRTVTFEKPEIFLRGDCWDSTWGFASESVFTIPDTEDGLFVSPAFKNDAEVRMHVNVSGADWWQTEFVANAKGEIDFRGAGGDQDRVKVKAGQKAYLNFKTGGGSYK